MYNAIGHEAFSIHSYFIPLLSRIESTIEECVNCDGLETERGGETAYVNVRTINRSSSSYSSHYIANYLSMFIEQ